MRTGSFFLAGLLALASVAGVAACGSDVETTPSSSGTGAGGGSVGGGSTSSNCSGAQENDPCCAPGACCTSACCSPEPECSTGGAGGAGSICGGKQGIPCGANEWCDYGTNLCGNADDTGVCTPKPLDCPEGEPQPTCACDGMVYFSECLANLAGQDVSNTGSCTPPGGTFNCGQTFCSTGQEYCVKSTSDVGGTPDSYGCKPLPAPCMMATPPSCDCLKDEPCGSICDVTAPGGLQLTCPGG